MPHQEIKVIHSKDDLKRPPDMCRPATSGPRQQTLLGVDVSQSMPSPALSRSVSHRPLRIFCREHFSRLPRRDRRNTPQARRTWVTPLAWGPGWPRRTYRPDGPRQPCSRRRRRRTATPPPHTRSITRIKICS